MSQERMRQTTSVPIRDDRCPICGASSWWEYRRALDRQAPNSEQVWSVRRCRYCRAGWTFPQPTSQQIRASYPESYLGDIERTLDEFEAGTLQRSRSWRNETDKAALLQRFRPSGRVLDVGCADGKFLLALDGDRWERWGVEFLEETVKLVGRRRPELNLIAGDIFSPGLDGRAFDVITLWHVFEHLPQPQAALRRMHQLMGTGGWLLVGVPNLDSLQARLFAGRWMGLDVPRHLFHYTPDSLKHLLKESGFRPRHVLSVPFRANIHHIKHSLLDTSTARFGNRVPYYLLKPGVFLLDAVERMWGRYGMILVAATKEATSRDAEEPPGSVAKEAQA